MIKIAKRSNKTRAEQRPPLTVVTPSPALLAEMGHFRVKPAHSANVSSHSNGAGPAGRAGNNSIKMPSRNYPGINAPVGRGTPLNGSANQAAQRTVPGPTALNGKKDAPHTSLFRRENFRPAAASSQPKSNGVTHPQQNGNSRPGLTPERSASPQSSPPAETPRPVASPPAAQVKEPEKIPVETKVPEPARVNPSPKDLTRPASGAMESRQNLERLMKKHPDLPGQTTLLGVCEDGLPVLLDLNNPAPGAVLVMGDERDKQLELLQTAISSVVLRNSPRQVQFLILSCEPQGWKKWVAEQGFQRFSIAIESAEDEVVRDWVLRLADWTEQRRLGERGGPAVLLVMDTLSFLPRLEYDVRLNFEWMAKEGPQAAIWPLAAISIDLAKALSGRRLLRAFKTRVLGYAAHAEDYIQLENLSEEDASNAHHPGQFMVQAGEGWLRFRSPGA